MTRFLRSLVLFVALVVLWLLLSQSLDVATVLLGVVLAAAAVWLTRAVRPGRDRLKRPLVALTLLGRVGFDLLRANVAVARLIVSRREPASGFVRIPLELKDPTGLAVLAMIVTATPGTAWAELGFDRSALLLHVLADHSNDDVVATIKTRYEQPLREIFE